MRVGPIPIIMGYTNVVAMERRKQYRSLAELAHYQRGWSTTQLAHTLSEEFVKFAGEWGPKLAGEDEQIIAGGTRNICSGLIELAQHISPDEQETFVEILKTAVKIHHEPTALHQERVENLSLQVVVKLRFNPDQQKKLRRAASLHDIGKIAVPVELLNADRGFNRDEEVLVKKGHLFFGYCLLDSILFLKDAANIVGYNHVFDGYWPSGFSLKAMPLEAQILSAVDFYDSLIDPRRNYNPTLPSDVALEIISQRSYDPRILSALNEILAARTAGT